MTPVSAEGHLTPPVIPVEREVIPEDLAHDDPEVRQSGGVERVAATKPPRAVGPSHDPGNVHRIAKEDFYGHDVGGVRRIYRAGDQVPAGVTVEGEEIPSNLVEVKGRPADAPTYSTVYKDKVGSKFDVSAEGKSARAAEAATGNAAALDVVPDEEPEATDYSEWNKDELVAEAKKQGVSSEGTKADIIARLEG